MRTREGEDEGVGEGESKGEGVAEWFGACASVVRVDTEWQFCLAACRKLQGAIAECKQLEN